MPNERDEVQALVRNYIPTDEQMNLQILYLLGIGKFYTPEKCGRHRQLQYDVERAVLHPFRTTEQCSLTDHRQQQLELRHKLQHRRKRLDGHGVRDNAFRATAEITACS